MALIHWNVKKHTIIMFQCETCLNTCLVWITMLVRFCVESDMVSGFPIMDWKKKRKQYSLILSATILI